MSSILNNKMLSNEINSLRDFEEFDLKERKKEVITRVQRIENYIFDHKKEFNALAQTEEGQKDIKALLEGLKHINQNLRIFKNEFSSGRVAESILDALIEKNPSESSKFNEMVFLHLLEKGFSMGLLKFVICKLNVDNLQNRKITQAEVQQILEICQNSLQTAENNREKLAKLGNKYPKIIDEVIQKLDETTYSKLKEGILALDEDIYKKLEEKCQIVSNQHYNKQKLQEFLMISSDSLKKALLQLNLLEDLNTGKTKVNDFQFNQIKKTFTQLFKEENKAHNRAYLEQRIQIYEKSQCFQVLEELGIKDVILSGDFKVEGQIQKTIDHNLEEKAKGPKRLNELMQTLSNPKIFSATNDKLPVQKALQEIEELQKITTFSNEQKNYLSNAKEILIALNNRQNWEGNIDLEKDVLKMLSRNLDKRYNPPKDSNTKDSLIRLLRNREKLEKAPPEKIIQEVKGLKLKHFEARFSTLIPVKSEKDENLIRNLAEVSYYLSRTEGFLNHICDTFVHQSEKNLNAQFGEDFSAWNEKHYDYTNLKNHKKDIVEDLLKKSIRIYKISELLKSHASEDPKKIAAELDENFKTLINDQARIIGSISKMSWVKSLLTSLEFRGIFRKNILFPYDQGKNLSEHLVGTCLCDTAEKLEFYLESDPIRLLKLIKQNEVGGSSAKARSTQLKPKRPNATFEETLKRSVESFGKLTYIETKTLGSRDKVLDELKEGAYMFGLTEKGNPHKGHEILLKIDHKNGIYMIRDNNVGIPIVFIHPNSWKKFENSFKENFPDKMSPIGDFEDFKKALGALLDNEYSDLTVYDMTLAKRKNP